MDYFDLIERIKQGDQQAFEALYKNTYNRVFFHAKKILCNEQDALEVLQDTYLTIYQRIDTLKNQDVFLSWIGGIVSNLSLKRLRKIKPGLEKSLEETEEAFTLSSCEDTPEKIIDKHETKEIIGKIVDCLPDLQRITVLLYYYDECSVSHIASIMECSEGTVKSRLNYARKNMKLQVEEHEHKGIKLYAFNPAMVIMALQLQAEKVSVESDVAMQILQSIVRSSFGVAIASGQALKTSTDTLSMKNKNPDTTSLGSTPQSTAVCSKPVPTLSTVEPSLSSAVAGSSISAVKIGGIILAATIAIGAGIGGYHVLNTQKNPQEAVQIEKQESIEEQQSEVNKAYGTVVKEITDQYGIFDYSRAKPDETNLGLLYGKTLDMNGDGLCELVVAYQKEWHYFSESMMSRRDAVCEVWGYEDGECKKLLSLPMYGNYATFETLSFVTDESGVKLLKRSSSSQGVEEIGSGTVMQLKDNTFQCDTYFSRNLDLETGNIISGEIAQGNDVLEKSPDGSMTIRENVQTKEATIEEITEIEAQLENSEAVLCFDDTYSLGAWDDATWYEQHREFKDESYSDRTQKKLSDFLNELGIKSSTIAQSAINQKYLQVLNDLKISHSFYSDDASLNKVPTIFYGNLIDIDNDGIDEMLLGISDSSSQDDGFNQIYSVSLRVYDYIEDNVVDFSEIAIPPAFFMSDAADVYRLSFYLNHDAKQTNIILQDMTSSLGYCAKSFFRIGSFNLNEQKITLLDLFTYFEDSSKLYGEKEYECEAEVPRANIKIYKCANNAQISDINHRFASKPKSVSIPQESYEALSKSEESEFDAKTEQIQRYNQLFTFNCESARKVSVTDSAGNDIGNPNMLLQLLRNNA